MYKKKYETASVDNLNGVSVNIGNGLKIDENEESHKFYPINLRKQTQKGPKRNLLPKNVHIKK